MGAEERKFLSGHIAPGMTVLDIGANVGLYSLYIAELVGKQGKVLAFEPDPSLFEAAAANIQQSGNGDVITLRKLALGSQTGTATLYRGNYNSGDNRLSASPTHQQSVQVAIARLDDVVDGERVDFVKIDVQGWEAEVLRGMEHTLKNNPGLTIYFEYWPDGLRKAGEEVLSPIHILTQHGFTVFWPDRDEPLSPRQIENLAKKNGRRRFFNLLARRS